MRVLSNDELDFVAGGDTGSLIPGPDPAADVTSYASFGSLTDAGADPLRLAAAYQKYLAWQLKHPNENYADYAKL